MSIENLPDKTIELPEPWYWTNADMVVQLQREIPDGHLLSNKALKTIARRQDCDDVLFELINDEFTYAVVHLTWATHKLSNQSYPLAWLYKNWQDLYDNRILVDKQSFQD